MHTCALQNLGCLKQKFKTFSKVGATHLLSDHKNYTVPNCTMPWHQSMLGMNKYNDTENLCNSEDAYNLYFIDYEFLNSALKGDLNDPLNKCKGKCK